MKITQKQMIFWILLDNAKNNKNEWLSAGAFCDREVEMSKGLGYTQWLSYKGATRISDTVFVELPESWIERKYFRSRNGTQYYKYRIVPKENIEKKRGELESDYKKVFNEFIK